MVEANFSLTNIAEYMKKKETTRTIKEENTDNEIKAAIFCMVLLSLTLIETFIHELLAQHNLRNQENSRDQ